jgi:Leucine-rich repeat (LRR) protein
MTTLDLSNQGVTQMPDLSSYSNLSILYLNDNLLTNVGTLPTTLTELYLQNNQITELVIPDHIVILNTLNNPLTTLELPDGLVRLTATFQGITEINDLPKSVLKLCDQPNMNLMVDFHDTSIDVFIH